MRGCAAQKRPVALLTSTQTTYDGDDCFDHALESPTVISYSQSVLDSSELENKRMFDGRSARMRALECAL
jgi:hypothetical protein